ncbi:hypothetical protein [Alicyclobacillus ferrooxydans]|uniref:Uncharacterized protein n=1 Tax=Alicyclobacillus ferrooxydans TaxID=471514 RepID=A0A0P9ELD8_9BACL|nr:hypothetical protein [Alicyclobacillus ferrooxydans]KPV44064.1 hypothetical protein AN477_09245 [Alicyclobacillus ferrooxydans]
MKVLKVLWGLLVDDGRLASILVISLVVAYIVSLAGVKWLAALVIWLGLIVSLWVSIEHQLKLKVHKSRG